MLRNRGSAHETAILFPFRHFTLLLTVLLISALATSGAIKIKVSLIHILVDGKVFQLKDASSNDVVEIL